MKSVNSLLAVVLLLFLSTQGVNAQPYAQTWTEISAYGDTVVHSWPPPDSTFSQTRIVIKFRPYVLNYDSLCYDCDTIVTGGLTADSSNYWSKCKEFLFRQDFTPDIVNDASIRGYLLSHGATRLTRMTPAHPRRDTLSLARNGDTLRMHHFNFIVAHLNNDSSVLDLLSDLYLSDTSGMEFAEPVYFGKFGRTPRDRWYYELGKQVSLTSSQIGMEVAWDYSVGSYLIGEQEVRTKVAVIDNGVDYFRCDLGLHPINSGNNDKVLGGWDYEPWQYGISKEGIYYSSWHGTPIAGIIGAHTNEIHRCLPPEGSANGMAGIGGGWGAANNWPAPYLKGVEIYGYNISERVAPPADPVPNSDWAAAAILESCASSLAAGYGERVEVINASWFYQSSMPLVIRHAVSESYNHFVNLAACTGNNHSTVNHYPAAVENQLIVTGVGASVSDGSRAAYSNHFPAMDLVAPGGDITHNDRLIFALNLDWGDGPQYSSYDPDAGSDMDGTSFATPHVAGVIANLRSHVAQRGLPIYYPEDFAGIVQSAAMDIGDSQEDPMNPHPDFYNSNLEPYSTGYDEHTGYGRLQADSVFIMLDPGHVNGGYSLFHMKDVPTTFGDWEPAGTNAYETVTFFDQDSRFNTYGLVSGTKYRVKYRKCSTTLDYSTLSAALDQSRPIYVWGNNGGGKSGWHLPIDVGGKILYSEPFCEITSSLGGLGSSRGLRHEHQSTVTAQTYQYAFYPADGNAQLIGHYPSDQSIGVPITIFAARDPGPKITTDAASDLLSPIELSFSHDAIGRSISVQTKGVRGEVKGVITDIVGRPVLEVALNRGLTKIDISNLAIGAYILCLEDAGRRVCKPLSILR